MTTDDLQHRDLGDEQRSAADEISVREAIDDLDLRVSVLRAEFTRLQASVMMLTGAVETRTRLEQDSEPLRFDPPIDR